MSGQPVCCGWNPRPRNGSRPRYSGNPGNQKPKEGARISQTRSTSAAGGGKHTYSARRSCPHLNPPPASGGGSAPPAQQYQPNFIVRRPSHGERSRSVKARKDAQPKRAGTASIGLNNSSKCHLAPTPRNGRTSLYRRTTSHAQSFANQRRRNSLGFTKTKSRSTSSRLTA